MAPEDVDLVVHTHMHTDHCGNNVRAGADGVTLVPTFPNAKHYVHRKEYEYAQQPFCLWGAAAKRNFEPIALAGNLVLVDVDGPLDAANAPQIEARLTVGHTPGHMTILLTASSGE